MDTPHLVIENPGKRLEHTRTQHLRICLLTKVQKTTILCYIPNNSGKRHNYITGKEDNMPAPIREAILAPETTRYRISAEPAVNVLQSLMMLTRVDHNSGFSDWVIETAGTLTPERDQLNKVVLYGLHYTLTPERSFRSFPAYIDDLAASSPLSLRDKCINAYLRLPWKKGKEEQSVEEILESEAGFMEFLRGRFDEELIIEEIESQAYRLLKEPAKMQTTIVDHLRYMWDEYLRDEWARVQPLVLESVAAFEAVELENMNDEQVIEYITGQKHEKPLQWLEGVMSIIFVPSAHAGPYTLPLHTKDTAWITFGVRQPEGEQRGISDLSRVELLVWLSALTDNTRLQILGLIRERDELCAQEIIDLLQLSQSTCSRHLRQLTASGYLRERRVEAGKCYSLNPERLIDTARAIESYAN
jgi:DNA-binding transcriptional ArsR family regulator